MTPVVLVVNIEAKSHCIFYMTTNPLMLYNISYHPPINTKLGSSLYNSQIMLFSILKNYQPMCPKSHQG